MSGPCFEKYRTTLSDQVNPGFLNKSMFLVSGRTRVDKGMRESLAGVCEAVSHLHSLGIIHNDIKPEHIMIDEMGRFILIDFDSCRPVGEALSSEGGEVKRTFAWFDEKVKVPTEKNDLDALAELRAETLLFGASEAEFMFGH